MARYGSGGYKQWEENRVTDYDKKTEGRELGLKGWAGNQTVEHHAKILAEQRGKPGADYGKGTKYWDQAYNQLILDGRKGADVHGQFRDYQMSEELADLRSQLEQRNGEDIPEAQADPAPQIEPKMRTSSYTSPTSPQSEAVQDAKERTQAYLNGSKESFNFYKGGASTENNQVEDPDSELPVANNKASTETDNDMYQSRHNKLNFSAQVGDDYA